MQLRLEELLRYSLAGAIGLLAFVLCFSNVAAVEKTPPAITQATILVGLSFALGTLIYAVHRAILYPLFYRFILWQFVLFRVLRFERRLIVPFFPSRLEVSLDLLRWKRGKEAHYAQSYLGELGAQVHFMYCSGWAVLLALELGKHVPNLTPTSSESKFWWGAWVMVVAAFVSNCRLAYYDSRLALHDAPDLGPTP